MEAGVQATHILCSGAASAQRKGDFLELTKGSVPGTGLIVHLAEGARGLALCARTRRKDRGGR